MQHLRFNLNGSWVELSEVPPTLTLLRYLREHAGLTGTKEGCAEGDCGACTVAVVEKDPTGQPVFRAVNACLLLLPMVQGKHVVTVEALKDPASGEYHAVQQALAKALGSQCGYCTPGIVMSLFEAAHRGDLDADWKLDDQLCGNLCRCTGYRPIREAAVAVAGGSRADRFGQALPQQGPDSMALDFEHQGQRFVTPTTLDGLWDVLAAHPSARLVCGGTDLSLEVTKRFEAPPFLVSLEGVAALRALEDLDTGFRLGATATVAELEDFAATRMPSVHRMTRYFGARQVKHRGTVGGNLCTASPIGDLAPVFISLNATALLQSRAGTRKVPLDEFFLGYRKTALKAGEVLAAVEVPKLQPTTRAAAYKVSKRRELDISTVSAGFVVGVDSAGRVTRARLAFGGMAATPRRATQAEDALIGQPWNEAAIEAAAKALEKDFTPLSDHRGSRAYRQLVAANLLRGFFLETKADPQPSLAPRHTATLQLPQEVQNG